MEKHDTPPNESILLNQPLDGSDQGKLLIFSLLMVPSVVLLVGVLPAIFIVFGIYMMKKNQDFSSIDTAVKNFRGYVWLSLIVGLAVSFYWWDGWMGCKSEWANIRQQARFCDYNTPQKLDKGLRWMITCRNLEEGRQDEKEKKVRCDIQG